MDRNQHVIYAGWNDPPVLVKRNAALRARQQLNKRIAYPTSHHDASASANMPPPPPPPPPKHLAQPPPASVEAKAPKVDPQPEERIDDQELKEILNNIRDVMDDGSKKTEISKRVDIMKTMWVEGKLDILIKDQVLDISRYIKENRPEEAERLYLEMIMDGASFGHPWMVGLKYLIHYSRLNYALEDTE